MAGGAVPSICVIKGILCILLIREGSTMNSQKQELILDGEGKFTGFCSDISSNLYIYIFSSFLLKIAKRLSP